MEMENRVVVPKERGGGVAIKGQCDGDANICILTVSMSDRGITLSCTRVMQNVTTGRN